MGLRERKKEQTRRRIAESAQQLFADRGFDAVSVAEVARAAEVAEATVFNYFPTKEGLFYSGLEVLGQRLLDAVAARPAGQPVLAAVRAFLLGADGQLDRIAAGDQHALDQARTTARIIAASAGLRARERQVLADTADALAELISSDSATGPGDDVLARTVATALVGTHHVLITYARRRVLADDRPRELAADVRAHGERAFALLEHGLGDHARASTTDPEIGDAERPAK